MQNINVSMDRLNTSVISINMFIDVVYLISLTSSPLSPDSTSNLKPFLFKLLIIFVLAKQAPGGNTPPLPGNFSFSFKIVVADNRRAVHVAP